eukprot:scaffold1039_cov101-Cylindrotheca_fusiformis.AAC.1
MISIYVVDSLASDETLTPLKHVSAIVLSFFSTKRIAADNFLDHLAHVQSTILSFPVESSFSPRKQKQNYSEKTVDIQATNYILQTV